MGRMKSPLGLPFFAAALFALPLGAETLPPASSPAATPAAIPTGKPKRELPAMLRKYDTDGNGILDPEEKAAMRQERAERDAARKADHLKRFDTNGDGKIDKAERKRMKETLKAEKKARKKAEREKKKQGAAAGAATATSETTAAPKTKATPPKK